MHFRVCTKTEIVYGKAYSSSSINLFLLNYIYVDFVILSHIHNSRKNNKKTFQINRRIHYTSKIQDCASPNTPYFAPKKHGKKSFPLITKHETHTTVISSRN